MDSIDEFEFKPLTKVGSVEVAFRAVFAGEPTWWVSFDTHTVKATDSDEPAIPVFAAAKKSLEMFIKAYKPKDINFSGAEKLGSIYERMLKKFLKDNIPSYKLVSQKPAYDESAIEFKLSRV